MVLNEVTKESVNPMRARQPEFLPQPQSRRLFLCSVVAILGWTLFARGPLLASQGGARPAESAPGNPVVAVSTSLGDFTIELLKDRAPVSVANFLQYVQEDFYPGTVFHRVKSGFMIQGGGFTESLVEKATRPPIQNEATNGLRNTRGTVAMARTRQLRSATSQFYVNLVDNRMLDHTSYSPDEFGYAVFGRVASGMDVVDRIAAVRTHAVGDMEDVPVDPVVIKSITLQK
jgi:cyclophilin family peptidyl-prolyl cis-trans isomerase